MRLTASARRSAAADVGVGPAWGGVRDDGTGGRSWRANRRAAP